MPILIMFGLFLVALVWGAYRSEWNTTFWKDSDTAFICVAGVLAVLACALYISFSLTSVGVYADLQVYDEKVILYQDAIEQTKDAVVKLDGKLTVVSLENKEHSQVTANRILEARDYGIEMAKSRKYYKLCWGNWFLKMWIAKPPAGLL